MWAPQVRWSGEKFNMNFDNTALYPPVFYVPSALGILIARGAGLTVVQTLTLSRILTGAVAVAVAATAIACAEAASVALFAVMTLPMSLALLASGSQDALLLACSAMAAALFARFWRRQAAPSRAEQIAAVVLLALICTSRPPYVGLALLPLTVPSVAARWRLASAAAVVLSVAAWSTLAAISAWTSYNVTGADPSAQATLLLGHPWDIARIALDTLQRYGSDYIHGFIGVFGWSGTRLPRSYEVAAVIVLGIAAAATMLGERGRRIGIVPRALIAGSILLSAAAVFGIEYLTWTPPGALVVDGVQGRYFLPLALVAAAALPALRIARLEPARWALSLAVGLLPIVTLGVTLRSIVLRYYLG